MSQIYADRRERLTRNGQAPGSHDRGPSVQELAAGARPSQEQMGHRLDLPGEIREKMESSFGADFSNVKIYESQTVADAGARAVAQGDSVVFAPGQFDTVSSGGQALLGHELSHIVSQARGESRGTGLLRDHFLESQADRQGQLAAAGQSVFSGPVTPVGVSTAASAAGPIQADKPEEDTRTPWQRALDDFLDEDATTESKIDALSNYSKLTMTRNREEAIAWEQSAEKQQYYEALKRLNASTDREELLKAMHNKQFSAASKIVNQKNAFMQQTGSEGFANIGSKFSAAGDEWTAFDNFYMDLAQASQDETIVKDLFKFNHREENAEKYNTIQQAADITGSHMESVKDFLHGTMDDAYDFSMSLDDERNQRIKTGKAPGHIHTGRWERQGGSDVPSALRVMFRNEVAAAGGDQKKITEIANRYGSSLKDYMDDYNAKNAGSGPALSDNKDMMDLAIEIAAKGTNSVMAGGSDTGSPENRLQLRINAFRGGTTQGAQGPMNMLMRDKINKAGLVNKVNLPATSRTDAAGNQLSFGQQVGQLSGEQLGDISAQIAEATASSPEIVGLLQQFKDQSFQGIEGVSEEDKSSAIMSNYVNRAFAATAANEASPTYEEKLRNIKLMKSFREEEGKLMGGKKSADALNMLAPKKHRRHHHRKHHRKDAAAAAPASAPAPAPAPAPKAAAPAAKAKALTPVEEYKKRMGLL